MADDPCVVRSVVEPRSSYQDYREELRWDFFFSCGYCTLAETEARAVGYEIDHYLPKSTNPDLANVYENLPPGERGYLLRLRDDLEDAEGALQELWSREARECLKSPFLEAADKKHNRRRRQEMRQLKALLPDDVLDD